MDTFFEGRTSESPYIHMIWHGHTGLNYTATCPAEPRWNLFLNRQYDQVKVSVEGPLTQALHKFRRDESDFLVIKFRLGAFFPHLPVTNLANSDAFLPEGASRSFWLDGSTWEFPNFDNAETFVDRLVRNDVLRLDPVVDSVLQNQPQDISDRTVRRRFIHSTGLTPKALQQIERAQQAAELLGKGTSILDAVYEAGYADQPHLTRSLKRFFGRTPAQIAAAYQSS